MATAKQKKAIKETLENIGKGKPVIMGKVMVKSGYSESMAKNPKALTKSKAWMTAFKEIDFGKHLLQVDAMADTEKNEDKDNAFKYKDMLFKLGDKYPKGETKIVGIFNKIEQIQE